MKFKCGCTMTQRLTGDGCQICNTEFSISLLPQPVELVDQLISQGFSFNQANSIGENIFQPLVSLIYILSNKIDQLAEKV